MLNINLKGENGIFNEVKLIDAFKDENGTTFVITYNNEKENNLLKIYVSKYEEGKLKTITDEEWSSVKAAMAKIINGTAEYELISMPTFVELVGSLKPCLIASIEFFENHYRSISEKHNNLTDTSKFRFTNGGTEWHRETKEEMPSLEESEETKKEESVSSIVDKVNALTREENERQPKKEINEETLEEETVLGQSDYKSQKTKYMNLISRGIDEIVENKNKEVLTLRNIVEKLETDLRKAELERNQALNVIEMYHSKIRKLNEALRESKEG